MTKDKKATGGKGINRRARAAKHNRAAILALREFERAIRRVHPELSTPTAYAELQALAIHLAKVTRRIIKSDEERWDMIEELAREVEEARERREHGR